jgi:hypothetical protein
VLIVARHQDIAAAYADPSAFHAVWAGGFEEDGYCLRFRAADAETGPEFLAAVQDGQWALARAARPGLTRYYPTFIDQETEVCRRQPARLQEVGYLAPAGIVEYTSVAAPGEHLAGWEIHRLAALLRERRMGDGQPVNGVRVVFLDSDAAELEKRPLLDRGIKVLALGANGLPVPVAP